MNKSDPELFLKEQRHLSASALKSSIGTQYVGGVFVIIQAALMAYIINALVFERAALSSLVFPLLGLGTVFLVRFILLTLGDIQITKSAARIQCLLREQLYETLQTRGPLFVTSQGSGALLNTLGDGVETIGKYYSQYLPAKAMMVTIPLTIWIFIVPFDWLSGLVMVVTAPFIPLFMILIGKGAENLNQKQWRKLTRMSNHFLDAIQGLTTLKLFNATAHEVQAIDHTSENYRRDTMNVLRLAFLSSVTLEFFSTVSIALIAVFIGFRLMWGEMDFTTGFFILLLAPEFYTPLRKMGTAYHARMEAIGAAEKIVEIMDCPVDQTRNEVPSKRKSTKSVSIRFENVYCSYGGARTALNGVTFELKPGTHTALIGPSGAGKSTVLALLLGFVEPEKGSIFIGDEPLHSGNIAHWRSHCAWVPQKPVLFHATIMENIRLGKPEFSSNDVKTFCRDLGIHEFITALPQGYETLIGENGYGLSGGQIRRIAIARALIQSAPVLFMDEPTASLDLETEGLLQKAMARFMKEKTVLSIAHRLHTIEQADQILFMENGEITDCGTHEYLLQRNAVYAERVSYDALGVTTASRKAAG